MNIENKNNIPSVLTLNSQFLQWDSANTLPKYWNSNGLNISRTGNTRSDAVLYIGSKNNSDASIVSTSPNITLPVYNFSNMLFTGDKFKVKLAYFGNVRVCIKVSSPVLTYFLTKSGDNYIWSTTFKFLNFQVPDDVYVQDRLNRSGDWRADFWYTSEISSPAIADTTFNKLELFVYPSYDNPNGYQFGGLLREFSVSLSVNNTNNYEGEIYKVSTDKNYTETYDDLVPTFGEFGNIGNTNQLIFNTSTGYIYTQNWYREGKTESKSLLEIASRSILNQYRSPYIQFTSSVRGDFDFGKVYNINNLAGRFMPFKATLNLKSDISSIEMFELLNESDTIESTYTFSKKANLGTADYNTITPKSAVDTNRPRPQRVYT
ncbi:hypothetical protein ACFOG5_09695 [Pedobacter fastidiosus]|uniref:Uncharacterized protein n=1 Tax=Pedobacter fastidiosus TaxID=2765361 RepID=A0ABR7KT65_9SPHI|nr:hypothetical protein [Pedobacter fastidiosus]MBC6111178.1 hypothetical protein [Pedobacter fastidiosus]